MHAIPRLVRLAVLVPLVLAATLAAASQAHAVVGTALYANGLHISTGSIVDPHGRIWVSDHNSGLCRIVDPTASGPGFIEHPDFDPATPLVPESIPTCLGGLLSGAGPGADASSAPAFYDPTPAAPDSGDERVYVPDGAAPSSEVYVMQWHPDTGLFTTVGTVTMDADPNRATRSRPLAASLGPDGFIYVGFQSSGSLQRFDPDAANPKAELVAHTSDNRGVSAVAAGFDRNGATTVYLAERTGVRQVHPSGGGSQAVPFTVDSPNAMTYDLQRHLLYTATANGVTAADAGIDHVQRVATDTGAVEEYANNLSMIGGLDVRPDGSVVVVNDVALLDPAEPLFQGTMFIAGLPASRITGGPGDFTSISSPTFTVAGDPGLQCSLVPVGSDPVWQDCASGSFTPVAPLADGSYVFATRSVTAAGTGIPVTRTFTVDTAAPGAPAITAPGDGSTVDGTPDFAFSGEPGAAFTCSLDDSPYAPCAPGAAFAFDANGAHTLRIRAVDAAGNVSDPSAPAGFTVDVSAPAVTVDTPGEGALTGRSPQFTYHASEAGVKFRCRLDNGPVKPCGASQGYAGVAPGTHTFQVGATDAVGNVGVMASRKVRVAGSRAGVDDGTGDSATLDGSTSALKRLRLGRLSMRTAVSRARLATQGLRVGLKPKKGTRLVRVRVYRGKRRLFEAFVTVRGTKTRKLTLRQSAVRRLGIGRYRLELTPGTSRTALGPATSRSFRVVG